MKVTVAIIGLVPVLLSSTSLAEQRRIKFGVISLCPSPKSDNGCSVLTLGQRFTIKSATSDSYYVEWNGKPWWADKADVDRSTVAEALTKKNAAVAKIEAEQEAWRIECERRGDPRIGMTRDQLYGSCWGRPSSINVTETAAGKSEQMVYPYRGYVYFEWGSASNTIPQQVKKDPTLALAFICASFLKSPL